MDILDNNVFLMESMHLELKNKSLQFKSVHVYLRANLNPFSFLYGFRYFMREWFYSVAIVVVCFLSIVNTSFFLIIAFGASKCSKVKNN
jgi:hypothetical protein